MWLIVLKPPKIKTSFDRFYDPILAPHGIYFRGKAIRALSSGLVTRNHKAGSFVRRSVAPGRRAVLLWSFVQKPPQTETSAECFYDPILAPHGIYFRGKAIQPLLYGIITRHHTAGLFETLRGAGQEGGPVVVNCIKTTKNRDKF